MKKLFLIVVGLVCSGCLISAAPIDDEETFDSSTEDQYSHEWIRNPEPDPCSSYFEQVKLNGFTYYVEIPSLCNPAPNIFKGDPGPDMWERCNDLDPVWQERIIREAMSSHNSKQ